MQISTIIFDYDGVLADNHQFNFQACRLAAEAAGINLTETEYLENFYAGQSLYGGAMALLSKHDRPDQVDNFLALKTNQDPLYLEAVQPIPGAIEFVNWCHDQGYQLAIGSGARRPLIKTFLIKYQLESKFTVLVTAEDVSLSKPDPETYLKVIQALKCDPRATIVIEDSMAGIMAGQAAGCKVVGLVSTSPAEKLTQADVVAANYSELPKLLTQLSLS